MMKYWIKKTKEFPWKFKIRIENNSFFVAIALPLPWKHMFPVTAVCISLKVFGIIMFINRKCICLTLLIVFGVVKADFMTINWNISTNPDNLHLERQFTYPLYQEVAPVPCDLTDSCDVLCPLDSDCDDSQRLSFQHLQRGSGCNEALSNFYCGCDEFDKPEWQSVLCYVFKNPVYLGKFFKVPKKIEKYGVFKNYVNIKRHLFYQNRQRTEEIKPKAFNQYGSPIMTYVPVGETFPSVNSLMIKIPLKDSSFACKSSPVRYRSNRLSVCLIKISRDLCQNGHALSALPHLVQSTNLSTYNNVPIVLRDLNFLKGVSTEVLVKCVKSKLTTRKFKKQVMFYFQKTVSTTCEKSFTAYQTVLADNICQNVLVGVKHEFILNGSEIVKLKVEYSLGDVALPVDGNDGFNDIANKYIYLKQKFSVNFFDTMVNSSDRNVSRDDEVFNRGYFMGEELNFGYKDTNKSATTWEKGMLGVFSSGDTCDRFSPITFGFNYFSTCHIRVKSSNCSIFRTAVEEKLEALLKGDTLAVYANLRPPYNNTVPLLRNFGKHEERLNDSKKCFVPDIQDILIQYSSLATPSGRLVHRILGVRVDRSFKNVSLDEDVQLTSRVLFLYVSSFKEKPMSRFWKRMFAPEQSENSWLYIFNGFDEVTPDEREEITFWSIFIIFLTLTTFAFTKLELDFFDLLFWY